MGEQSMGGRGWRRRELALGSLCTTAACALPAWGQPAVASGLLPVEPFFLPPQLAEVKMNPSGTHVALLLRPPPVGGEDPEKVRQRLVVVDLATMQPQVVALLDVGDVLDCHWVNDRRLLMRTLGNIHANWAAVDADGSNWRVLGRPRWWLVPQGPQTGESVLLLTPADSSDGLGFFRLARMSTRSGHLSELDVPPWSTGFLIDHRGEPLAAFTEQGERARVLWRDGNGWKVVHEHDRFLNDGFGFSTAAPDGRVYVTARQGDDLTALYTWDRERQQPAAQPLLRLDGFDVLPTPVHGADGLLGVRVLADAWTTVWFDERMKAVQARIDEKLPATTNLVTPPRRGDSPWLLVWAYSDRQPPQAYVAHRESGRLVRIGNSAPHIDPARMSAMDYAPYKARDGRTIPAYLTLPQTAGAKRPLPLVVLVHGGPFLRGASWQWDAEVQFLASRGYAVLQPEFRGSTGFGASHHQAGWKQWGRAMQDDLADGARWAIAQGIADPKRIAIAGASYGGYAAMMGLVRDPELYACAINWIGVTDLELLFDADWSDMGPSFRRHGLSRLVGDRKADAAMLREHSPIHRATDIRKPVLMAYGRLDRQVPIEHGERMRNALRRHNPNVEWVLYDEEGHGWHKLKTQVDFWTRVEKFLARHLTAA
jgi:dipeptidyl aminopeptidase/acylaminoacyl peptidase